MPSEGWRRRISASTPVIFAVAIDSSIRIGRFSASLLRGAACLVTAAALSACGGSDDNVTGMAAAVALPSVQLVQAAGAPLGAALEPIQASGYVEQGFYVRGQASRYRIVDKLANAQLIDSGNPYATRVLVRRLTDPARFNGDGGCRMVQCCIRRCIRGHRCTAS